MAHGRNKERARLKRQRKKQEQRRQAQAPLQYWKHGHIEKCLCNPNWEEQGFANVYVLRALPGGKLVVASLHIDIWCAGLLRVDGSLDVPREAIDNLIEGMRERGPMEAVDPEAARQLVAAGIRFAHENSFRLPRRWERWTSVLGDMSDWPTADLSHFRYEHETLHWIGPRSELARRYMGDVDEFLRRPDVHYTMEVGRETFDTSGTFDDDDILDDEGDCEVDDEGDDERDERFAIGLASLLQRTATHATEMAQQWCFANGEAPDSRLGDAASVTLLATFITTLPDMPLPPVEITKLLEEANEPGPLADALAQFRRFGNSFKDAKEFANALGLPTVENDEEE